MKTVLFIILPFTSHYYPAFSIAEKYRNEGYRIVFTCSDYVKNTISNESFESVNIHYLSEPVLSNFKQFLGLFIQNVLDKNNLKLRLKDFYYTQLSLRKAIEEIRPDKIFLETNVSEYYLFFKDFEIDTELISIYLSTEKKVNIPPLNSNFIPKNTLFSKIMTEMIWRKYFFIRTLNELISQLAFLGKDDYFFQKRICKKNNWVWGNILNKNYFHSTVCKELTNNILVSPKLEFIVYKPNPKERFINYLRDRNEAKYLTSEYIKLREYLQTLKKEGVQIIYLAFGTLISTNNSRIIQFIENVLEIVERNPSYRLIYSFPLSLSIEKDKNHSFHFDFLPQLDILKYADLMITHGGLGSIKECMDANVPMLVVPINYELDQLGNAARIEANGLGKRIFLDATLKQIEPKLNDLLKTQKQNAIRENHNLHN